jgi:hypothetical protein
MLIRVMQQTAQYCAYSFKSMIKIFLQRNFSLINISGIISSSTTFLIKGIRNYRITKDLVWEVNEEILSVKLDPIVKVYLYDSAWDELKALNKITDKQIRSKRCPIQLKFSVVIIMINSTITLLVNCGNF